MAWVLDLDGVIWRGREAIAGSADAVAELRQQGEEVVFATNNAGSRITSIEDKLENFGIPARGAVMSAAQAGASMLDPQWKVLVIGGPGIHEQVRGRGCVVVESGSCDAVITAIDRDFTYSKLTEASLAIQAGAIWIACNVDHCYPTERGLEPAAGSIAAAIATASGKQPIVAGKPHAVMADMILDRCGPEGVVVGDQADTDGALARRMGYSFALVMSGTTQTADLPVKPAPDLIGVNLQEVVKTLLDEPIAGEPKG